MSAVVASSRFRRDAKRMAKRGKSMEKLKAPLSMLKERKDLPWKFRDHSLRGNWAGFRKMHIEPDWLLVCRIEGDEVRLVRTGTHSDLFR